MAKKTGGKRVDMVEAAEKRADAYEASEEKARAAGLFVTADLDAERAREWRAEARRLRAEARRPRPLNERMGEALFADDSKGGAR